MTQHKREWYIPAESALLALEGFSAVVYLHETKVGKLGAVGFYGKAQKPAFNYTFKSAAQRSAYCCGWLCDQAAGEEARNARKAEQKATRAAFINPFQIGDVLLYSWGYEQTNPEFYQVVEVKGKSVMLRRIASQTVEGSTYEHGMACQEMPVFDKFTGQPFKKLVQPHYSGKGGSVRFDFGCGNFWGNKENPGRATYRSWYA